MRFASEAYSESLIQEMMPLWAKHHAEIAAFKDIPLNPDLKQYAACAESQSLVIFTARQSEVLVGYQVFVVTPHPHSKQSIQAVQDVLFMDPEHRRGMAGYRFLKWCVDQLQSQGVQVVHQHISAAHDFGSMLRRLGFHLEDLVYSRRLI